MVVMRDSSGTALAVNRLTGWDPLGFEAGDNNWYRFVANGPTEKTDPSGLQEVNTGVKICSAYLKGDILWETLISHEFIAIDDVGFGRFERDNRATGTAVIKSDDLIVYPERSPDGLATGAPYSICSPVFLDSCRFDIAAYRQALAGYISEHKAAPGSYAIGIRDCGTFVRDAHAHAVWMAKRPGVDTPVNIKPPCGHGRQQLW
jgi:hypothetical protein